MRLSPDIVIGILVGSLAVSGCSELSPRQAVANTDQSQETTKLPQMPAYRQIFNHEEFASQLRADSLVDLVVGRHEIGLGVNRRTFPIVFDKDCRWLSSPDIFQFPDVYENNIAYNAVTEIVDAPLLVSGGNTDKENCGPGRREPWMAYYSQLTGNLVYVAISEATRGFIHRLENDGVTIKPVDLTLKRNAQIIEAWKDSLDVQVKIPEVSHSYRTQAAKVVETLDPK